MIERLLEDPSFHQSLLQILLEQRQPCAVATLPAVNIGVIAAVPAVLYTGSDNDPEKWSKEYKRLEAFPLCNEPYLELPDNSMDSSVLDPHDVSIIIYIYLQAYKCCIHEGIRGKTLQFYENRRSFNMKYSCY